MRIAHSERNRRRRVWRNVATLFRYIRGQMPGRSLADVWTAMWFADLRAYRDLGHAITGAHWFKTPDGPRPAIGTGAPR